MKFKREKRTIPRDHVHLTIHPAVYKAAKIKAAKDETNISHAVEALLEMWVNGEVKLD